MEAAILNTQSIDSSFKTAIDKGFFNTQTLRRALQNRTTDQWPNLCRNVFSLVYEGEIAGLSVNHDERLIIYTEKHAKIINIIFSSSQKDV